MNAVIRNYLKIALRNLLRNKVYSLITISGLAAGIACCILLALYIQDENSYDKHHQRTNDLYRLTSTITSKDGEYEFASCSPPIAWTLKEELPEIETVARALHPPGVEQSLIRYGKLSFYESDGYVADATIFDILTYSFQEGNPQTALTAPNTVVISAALAHKLFGPEPALNKVITITQGAPEDNYTVTGVLSEQQHHSFLQASFFTSMSSPGWGQAINESWSGEWIGQNFIPAYLKLKPGTDPNKVKQRMNLAFAKHVAEQARQRGPGFSKTLGLEPIADVYLKSAIRKTPRITYVYVIAAIATIILVLACINFMNLSTARATRRAAEIGLRKTLGAARSVLIGQLLGEAMVLVFISVMLSLVIVQIAIPWFNHLTDKTIAFSTENSGYITLALIAITVVTGLLSGAYPAFYLSAFDPVHSLKTAKTTGNTTSPLRRFLVVFQFVMAIALVSGMLIIGKQLSFMRQANLGYDATSRVVIPLQTETARAQYATLTKELSAHSAVAAVTGADYTPGSLIWYDRNFYTSGGDASTAHNHSVMPIDYGYFELLGINFLAGNDFTGNRQTDSQNRLVINQTGVKALGLTPETAIGETIYTESQGERVSYEIIGVIEDYHQRSLHEKINPIVFIIPQEAGTKNLLVHLNPGNTRDAMTALENIWKKVVPDTPFDYSFLDQDIRQYYRDDQRTSQIITAFTIIAFGISCLGLYGLSAYLAERRFREIGIRKVMGAGIGQILRLMSKEFVILIGIAFAIAIPLTWYGMTQWLHRFAYHISIDAITFMYAGLITLSIAIITISYQSLRAAVTNPVNALRNE